MNLCWQIDYFVKRHFALFMITAFGIYAFNYTAGIVFKSKITTLIFFIWTIFVLLITMMKFIGDKNNNYIFDPSDLKRFRYQWFYYRKNTLLYISEINEDAIYINQKVYLYNTVKQKITLVAPSYDMLGAPILKREIKKYNLNLIETKILLGTV
jgi:hypothetical protein